MSQYERETLRELASVQVRRMAPKLRSLPRSDGGMLARICNASSGQSRVTLGSVMFRAHQAAARAPARSVYYIWTIVTLQPRRDIASLA